MATGTQQLVVVPQHVCGSFGITVQTLFIWQELPLDGASLLAFPHK